MIASPMTASPVHSPTALMAKTMTPLSGQPSLPASFGITSLAGPKISVDIQQVQRARNTASALNSPLSATASSPLLEATVEPVLLQNNWYHRSLHTAIFCPFIPSIHDIGMCFMTDAVWWASPKAMATITKTI